ncbi:Necrosis inducing protein NPP1 [Phytophthora megakarya]|uniref:Necrosis inducing protein NPP1 n=1 Tax=Phytophthora megakarya TaxID=4795 RepID=A0A225WGK1_9STRA|nr:Necrosis inducing protein NPP1 [Phytophthora megakarya]
MHFYTFVLTLISVLVAIHAEVTYIDYDQVEPFTQPKPTTVSDKAAVKYKPLLTVSFGCYPYPVVQADGAVSAGLGGFGGFGYVQESCMGSNLGSQVYARSAWYNEKWAIMYAWYLPRGQTPVPTRYLDGSSVKIDQYRGFGHPKPRLQLTEQKGQSFDLITWDQLPAVARDALNEAKFDNKLFKKFQKKMPLKDGPTTVTDKAAVKYKPLLTVSYGCYPYPAVQANGAVSAGLGGGLGIVSTDQCTGSDLGSQVYARSAWYKGKWAIFTFGIFLVDESIVTPLATFGRLLLSGLMTLLSKMRRKRKTPVELQHIENSSVKLDPYRSESQDLITWDQLPAVARKALPNAKFDNRFVNTFKRKMSLKDRGFEKRLKDVWPF